MYAHYRVNPGLRKWKCSSHEFNTCPLHVKSCSQARSFDNPRSPPARYEAAPFFPQQSSLRREDYLFPFIRFFRVTKVQKAYTTIDSTRFPEWEIESIYRRKQEYLFFLLALARSGHGSLQPSPPSLPLGREARYFSGAQGDRISRMYVEAKHIRIHREA